MGGQLLEALGTVIVGMGVVFAALILICLIIYAFRIIPFIENKLANRSKKSEPVKESAPQHAVAAIPVTVNGITNEEIAAIAAAIEAYTGMNQSDFIVRRIVRR